MPNGMKILPIIILALCLSGCSLMNVKTTITDPDGKIWEISSKSDALCIIEKKDGTKLTVDNRGKMSVIEAALGLALTNTNINLGLSNEPQEID